MGSTQTIQLYISRQGNDGWSGQYPQPTQDGKDGPLATIAGARELIRRLKEGNHGRTPALGLAGSVVVWIRGGRYSVREPIVFGPEDSAPVTYAAYQDEIPILDGGERITNWKREKVQGKTCWVAQLPEVAEGKWNFRQLFVNGKRRFRSRLPEKGFYWIQNVPGLKLPADEGGENKQNAFICAKGDIQPWKNIADVEIVVLHWWVEERFLIVAFDPDTRLVKLGRTSRFPLADDQQQRFARYYIENVFESLQTPGQWYLDRREGKLYYLPMPGENPEKTEVFAPRVLQLLKFVGCPPENKFVEFLKFKGLTFQHTDWRHPGEDSSPISHDWSERGNDAAASQAASDVPGVISFEGARYCSIEDCNIRNIGWYGIELADGCIGNRIIGNEIFDMGAGGVKLNGADAEGPRPRRTGNNQITDNHIQAGGRVFHSAAGILSMHSFGNVISHNHIHDLFYSGISCGWVWGYKESVSRDNRIEKNHIHDIGQHMLSDMGGIYLLGVQPGTVVRGNLIHDVYKLNYGAWCIYTDEGSSHILIENNVCYRTNDNIFHQHYGRENVVRNNIFMFAEKAIVCYTRVESHVGFTFQRNILITEGKPIFLMDCNAGQRRIISDLNLFWDVSNKKLIVNAGGGKKRSLIQWQKIRNDLHSVAAGPRFKNLKKLNLKLEPASPALKLGFVPIDLSRLGPRPKNNRNKQDRLSD